MINPFVKMIDKLKQTQRLNINFFNNPPPCPHIHQHTTTTYTNEMVGWEVICDDCGELISED